MRAKNAVSPLSRTLPPAAVWLGVLTMGVATAQADQTNVEAADEILVFERSLEQIGSASSASEGLVGYADLGITQIAKAGAGESVQNDGSLLVNAGFGYRLRDLEFRLDVFNLLNSDDNDISYYYGSSLPGENPGGVNDVHFHPLEPRTVRASVTALWGG